MCTHKLPITSTELLSIIDGSHILISMDVEENIRSKFKEEKVSCIVKYSIRSNRVVFGNIRCFQVL